ncbi:BNR-4 repeat-containing protein [Albibacterium indicum]|uniref:BNR-4 repeat-containing protein n=1 Tax=Albibacterium indicum TaxID=2292082 RepID=UPI000E4B1C58|nr:BNR-4 repeat-containing protein [Pedobacter indicus]
MNRKKILAMLLMLFMLSSHGFADEPKKIITFSEDAGWCWFQDNRAILDGNQFLFSVVRSDGTIAMVGYHLDKKVKQEVVLNDSTFETDDHNVGVIMKRPDGRYLTVYAGHGNDTKMRYRISKETEDISDWSEEKSVETGGRTTYSNVYALSKTGLTYNLHRGIDSNPNYMVSDDYGSSWTYGGQLFAFRGRPYVRYASDDMSTIHFITTEEHPRHYNNSIYYGYMQGDNLYKAEGELVGAVNKDKHSNLRPQDFTCIYDSDSTTRENVAWTSDIQLDKQGYPYVAFTVTKDPISLGETKKREDGGFDHRYHYARWDGARWNEYEIAYGGSRLYLGENEYTGLITLHPDDPNVVYISTDVDPVTGKPLAKGDKRIHEIFKGTTGDGGKTWKWMAITEHSDSSNIRPIVVSNDYYEVVFWLRGRYSTYKDYDLKAVGLIYEK